MKKLYYVVEKELQGFGDNEGTEETTGHKSVRVYDLVNDKLVIFCQLDIENGDNSEDEILGYCEDNGLGDEIIKLTQL